jgi:hypothetical protein
MLSVKLNVTIQISDEVPLMKHSVLKDWSFYQITVMDTVNS